MAVSVHDINSDILLGLISLHFVTLGFYFFIKGLDLVNPFIMGKKFLNDVSAVIIIQPKLIVTVIVIFVATHVGIGL